MERIYDIFEVSADGVRVWRGAVQGRDLAIAKMQALAAKSHSEFQVVYVPGKQVVAVSPPRKEQLALENCPLATTENPAS